MLINYNMLISSFAFHEVLILLFYISMLQLFHKRLPPVEQDSNEWSATAQNVIHTENINWDYSMEGGLPHYEEMNGGELAKACFNVNE